MVREREGERERARVHRGKRTALGAVQYSRRHIHTRKRSCRAERRRERESCALLLSRWLLALEQSGEGSPAAAPLPSLATLIFLIIRNENVIKRHRMNH